MKIALEQSARPLHTSWDFFSLPQQLWSTRSFNQEGQVNPGCSNLVLLGFSTRAEVGSEPSSRNPVRQQARLLGTLSNTEQQTHQQCGESTWEMASTITNPVHHLVNGNGQPCARNHRSNLGRSHFIIGPAGCNLGHP